MIMKYGREITEAPLILMFSSSIHHQNTRSWISTVRIGFVYVRDMSNPLISSGYGVLALSRHIYYTSVGHITNTYTYGLLGVYDQ